MLRPTLAAGIAPGLWWWWGRVLGILAHLRRLWMAASVVPRFHQGRVGGESEDWLRWLALGNMNTCGEKAGDIYDMLSGGLQQLCWPLASSVVHSAEFAEHTSVDLISCTACLLIIASAFLPLFLANSMHLCWSGWCKTEVIPLHGALRGWRSDHSPCSSFPGNRSSFQLESSFLALNDEWRMGKIPTKWI